MMRAPFESLQESGDEQMKGPFFPGINKAYFFPLDLREKVMLSFKNPSNVEFQLRIPRNKESKS